ncbi:MAG: extracellular solute-binding protein, partial [Candidatus Limnocylindrus sp.]
MYLRKWRLSAIAAVMMLLAVACGGSTSSEEPAEVVQLRWFVGLGTGDNVETQVPVQQAVVDRWNAANPNIQVTLEVVPNADAKNTLLTQNAAGNPPDVVGPAGVAGSNGFYGQWLDLTPLIEESGYDLA